MKYNSTQRVGIVFADGSALFLNADGIRLKRREFAAGEQAVKADLDKPVTLVRCKDLCDRFDISYLKIDDMRWYNQAGQEIDEEWVFAYGEGCDCTLWQKSYIYNPQTNSLIIWEDGVPIYANDDGLICKDLDALADTLM